MSERNLRVGVPSKGRLSDLASDLLNQAGFRFRRQNRSLFAKVRDFDVDITFLRTDDIPVLCAEGAIDLGITGSDLVAEANVDVQTKLALGVGKCKLSVCVPEDSDINDVSQLHDKRIATSFPNVTHAFLRQHSAECHAVELSGSVEVMITLGIADAIVDLVETGSTLAANRLRILADIGSYETVLIQGDNIQHANVAKRLIRRLQGVVIARDYSLLEYNIHESNLKAAEAITPGFNSPTLARLENEGWLAMRVMVKRKSIIDTMEQLEKVGATAILETEINNCRL